MFGIGIGELVVIAGILAVVVGPLVLLWIFVWGPTAKRPGHRIDAAAQMMHQHGAAQLQLSGMPAQARVISVRQAGASVSTAPQCVLELEVYSGTTPPYAATVCVAVPPMAVPRVQPGMVVPIRVDPLSPTHIALAL